MGTLYSAMSVWTYLGKCRNDAYGEGELRTGFAKLSSRRSLKQDAGLRASRRSKAPPGISRIIGEEAITFCTRWAADPSRAS